ncbi:probable salivary secreted peptide [Copidosoma floridanum]|uniref:probable salivary secreted peptide n=1 Tax=Copidosoma floridanum TaxID=29053 RepID=UPI0006C9AE44|nr:probable salivary secreted peptide [Copidosoma floridanum]XP_023247262.1 probable salivary secreted peptide [Copidosoma floridanum]
MAAQRLCVALLLIALAIASSQAAMKNDLIVGARVPGDRVIQAAIVQKSHAILQVVKLKKTFIGNNYSTITQVRLMDQNKNGNGATPTIINGGPGHNFVTVEFKSVRGHSIDFIVELYGRP